jgi:FlaA1/EpsC-like NDP-sugar epimerase
MRERIDTILETAHIYKRFLSILGDVILLLLSLFLAFLIRLGSIDEILARHIYQLYLLALIVTPLKVVVFWLFRLYHISFRYISFREALSILKASALSSPMISVTALIFRDTELFLGFPRSIVFIDFFLTFFFITGVRAFFRLYYSNSGTKKGQETLIVGAGSAGEQLVRDILRSPKYDYLPVGFIDDDLQKRKTQIHGIKVLGTRKDIPKFVKDFDVRQIIIAIPSASSREIKGIMEYVRNTGLKDVKVLPGFSDLMNGNVTLKDIRDISIEDLLGREPVKIDMEKVASYIKHKNILVTGAGGSIGSELCRQIARFDPAELIVLDMGETELFNIDLEIRERYPDLALLSIVGDIRDESRIKKLFKDFNIDIVFHSAAYKHVPLMEANPREAVLNNVYGTKVAAEISSKSGVDRFINISTDKAVNPSSIMGATKRVAENLILGLDPNGTIFITVRFGNVLGSRGSVIPIFQNQIQKGGPITITDYEMKRYFMTIPEAVQLVMQAGAMGKGGDVFVLDMGDPVSIYQVAEELIRLSGLEPDKDIPIVISGKRPGEKLYEELLTAEEGTMATLHEKIYRAKISRLIDEQYLLKVDRLIALTKEGNDRDKITSLLRELVPTYKISSHNT